MGEDGCQSVTGETRVVRWLIGPASPIWLVLAPALGAVAIIMGGAGSREEHDSLFPVLVGSYQHGSVMVIVLIAGVGWLLGRVSTWHPVLLGSLVIVVIPVIAAIEISGGIGSHNIWPIEMVMYGVSATVPILAAYFGRLRRQPTSPKQPGVNSP